MGRDNRGYSLVEMMMSILILGAFFAGGYSILSAGRAAWSTVESNIALQDSIRRSFDRVSAELRQSDTGHFQILNGVGPNNSDSIRFSIPIICHTGDNLIDLNGDVAHWGAPLTWGCTSSTCMDADDDCSTADYATVEYLISNGAIVRRILNGAGNQVREDLVAQNIIDFQVQLTGQVVHVDLTAQQKSAMGRTLTTVIDENISLRN